MLRESNGQRRKILNTTNHVKQTIRQEGTRSLPYLVAGEPSTMVWKDIYRTVSESRQQNYDNRDDRQYPEWMRHHRELPYGIFQTH